MYLMIPTMTLTCLATIKNSMWGSSMMIMDQISAPLIILLVWIAISVVMVNETAISKESSKMNMTFFFLSSTIMLMFMANKLMMIYILFETAFFIMFWILIAWGSSAERMSAAFFMLFFTLAVSLPFLITLISMMKTTSIQVQKEIMMKATSMEMWLLITVFLFKMPVFMAHIWLPKAHVEAPLSGSMVLAGVMLKIGGFGILRIMADNPTVPFKSTAISFALISASIVGWLAMSSTDKKMMVAYSSISHMALLLATMLTSMATSKKTSMMIMLSHGVCSASMFMLITTFYYRNHSRNVNTLKSTSGISSINALWWSAACMLNISIPPTTSFIAEISMMWSVTFLSNSLSPMIFAAVMMTSVFSIWMMMAVIHGKEKSSNSQMSVKESSTAMMLLTPIIIMVPALKTLWEQQQACGAMMENPK